MVAELTVRAKTAWGKFGLFISMMLLGCIAWAQQDTASVQPPPPADATAMVAFLFIFIGMIVAYVAWIFHQQKKKKKAEMAQPDKT